MRFLLILFLALASGIALTLLAENPGYILITREPWSLETSLTMFALGLFLAFALTYLFVRLIKHLVEAPGNLRRWQNQRNRNQAIKDTMHGLAAAINGNWTTAEKLLGKTLSHSPQGQINLLASAWLAQQNNEIQKRDDFITAASNYDESSSDIETATAHVQVMLQRQAGQMEQAVASARILYEKSPTNPAAVRSLTSLLKETKQWQELQATLSAANKHHIFPEKELLALQIFAASKLMASAETISDIDNYWKNMPKLMRKQTDVIVSYSRGLIHLDQHQEADVILRAAINEQWSDEMIGLFGQLKTADPASLLKYAESWLTEHPTNSSLMLCMGRLAIQNKLWGMARSFLELGVQNGDNIDAYLELAWLFESMNETEKALNTYRSGLEKCLNSGPKTFTVPSSSNIEVYEGEEIIPDAVLVENKENRKSSNNSEDTQSPSLAYSNESK